MRVNLLIILIIIGACSSTPKGTSKKVDDIKDADFNKVRQVKYRKSTDVLSNVKSEYSDVTNRESIDRIYKYDGDIELKGPMQKVARLCYDREFQKAYKIIELENRAYLSNPIYWNQVGTCYLQEGNLRKALLFYNKALSLRKSYAPALNNLGIMYVKKGDYSRARVAFERARKTRSFSRVPRLNLANLYLSFGLYEHALVEVKVLKSLSSSDIDVLNMSATAKLMSNDLKGAIRDFESIPEKFWEQPKIGLNFAMANFLAGNKARAIDLYEDVDFSLDKKWKSYGQEVSNYLGVK